MTTPIIVLRPQSEWHGTAEIDANVSGLLLLRKQINFLLGSGGNGVSFEPFAPDGDEYVLNINLHSDASAESLPTAYAGFPAEMKAQQLQNVLQTIRQMSELGYTTGISLEHAQSQLQEIQRMAAKALEGEKS